MRILRKLQNLRVARVRSLAAKHGIERIQGTLLIIQTHVQRTLKPEVRKLITYFKLLKATPLFRVALTAPVNLFARNRVPICLFIKINIFGFILTKVLLDGSNLEKQRSVL